MAVTSENIEDVCKCLAWLGNEDVAVSGHSAIISHNQNPKYLVYYFHSQMFFAQKRKLAHGTKVIEVTPDTLKSIELPVPPLEVQREIVHILDSFTLLTAELTAELTARKKQYEYYRNQLLTFDNTALASLLDYLSEQAEDQNELSLHSDRLAQVLLEANRHASLETASLVSAAHVKKAIGDMQYRSGYLRQLFWQELEKGQQLISTQGKAIGQVFLDGHLLALAIHRQVHDTKAPGGQPAHHAIATNQGVGRQRGGLDLGRRHTFCEETSGRGAEPG